MSILLPLVVPAVYTKSLSSTEYTFTVKAPLSSMSSVVRASFSRAATIRGGSSLKGITQLAAMKLVLPFASAARI